MNISKLKGKMAEKSQTYVTCAKALGLSTTTFSDKMNGKRKFYIDELDTLGSFLEMSGKEKSDIFLS